MQQERDVPQNIFYRHFDLPANFPVIGLLGDSWRCVREPVTRMHFHNGMEIGYLFEGSDVYYLGNEQVRFEAPCVVIAPPNVPHAHLVDEGAVCRWNWLYVDPQTMLPQLSPVWRASSASISGIWEARSACWRGRSTRRSSTFCG